jgi:NAD(P)-dependent dehydrogenase (short-subunit alcohol dehydrogenase family)
MATPKHSAAPSASKEAPARSAEGAPTERRRAARGPRPGGAVQGRHALVTGAAQGIGAAIARGLVLQGASVSLLGRRRVELNDLAAKLKQEVPAAAVHVVVADVSDAAAVEAAVSASRTKLGPVHVLVNNAGQASSAPFAKITLLQWQQLLAVNLTGTFLCTQSVLPDMQAAGWGRVINIASTAGLRGYAYVAAYAASKHGVIGLTRSLALEVATQGITVNAVCPGYTETEILQSSIRNVAAKTGRSPTAARAEFTKANPQGRIVQPQEVAATVLWLCTAGAAAITGQSISVSGGEVM